MNIAICQPVVPKYRTPVFNALAACQGIRLTVYAGAESGGLRTDAAPRHYALVEAPVMQMRLWGMEFRWQSGQLRAVANRDHGLIILSWDIHYLSLPLALVYAKVKGKPVVLWGHGYSKRGSGLRDRLRNLIGKTADAVIVYSTTVAKRLVDRDGFRRERVFVAQNAIDSRPVAQAIQRWRSDAELLQRFKAENSLDSGAVVLFVSRLEPENEIDILIKAMPALLRRCRGCRLVIVGEGSDRERLEALVAALNVAASVTFTGAIYDEERLAPWMLSATLFCYPRNIGLSILHAYSYGLPVVTGDDLASHNPEIEALVPEVTGSLFRDRDVDDLVAKLLRIIGDDALRSSMSAQASRQAREVYTLDNMVGGFVELLRLTPHWSRPYAP